MTKSKNKTGSAAIREILMDCITDWAAAKPKDRFIVRDKYGRKIYSLIKSKR